MKSTGRTRCSKTRWGPGRNPRRKSMECTQGSGGKGEHGEGTKLLRQATYAHLQKDILCRMGEVPCAAKRRRCLTRRGRRRPRELLRGTGQRSLRGPGCNTGVIATPPLAARAGATMKSTGSTRCSRKQLGPSTTPRRKSWTLPRAAAQMSPERPRSNGRNGTSGTRRCWPCR